MIELSEVTKKYGAKTAVDRLSLRVESGELFAFLGPNGAGKTTTIKLVCGLLFPTEGSVRVGGFDLQTQGDEARQMISLQGVKMKRPSRIHISIDSDAGRITRVRVGGQSMLVGRGELVI